VSDEKGYRTGIRISTYGLQAGPYDAILVDEDGKVAARTRFTVVAPDSKPEVTVDAAEVAAGGTLKVRWSGAPGERFDWIGIFAAGDPNAMGARIVRYTDARLEGEASIELAADGKPLPPGRYEARLLRNDSYVVLAGAPFTIGKH
jgi:hypothetical protein